jgi:hypothetical protein
MKEKVKEYACNVNTFNENTTSGEDKNQQNDQQIIIKNYRLPYMTMERSTLSKIFYSLFGMVVILALAELEWFINSVSVFGATCVPLSLYVIPGYYYAQYHKGYNRSKYLSGRIFAIFGVFIMIAYTSLVVYSDSNFEEAKE